MHGLSFGQVQLEFLILLALSFICGALIGGEREYKRKPAGLRTHILVVTASMLFAYMSHEFGAGDPTRIAAQIVSGVGFLGAGLILKTGGNRIDNVTTAASIWFAASVGLALGFEYYFIAVVASVYAVIVGFLPHHPFRSFQERSQNKKSAAKND